MLAVTVSMITCTFEIVGLWNKWNENPVTVTFNDKAIPIEMIPNPAITICSTQNFANGNVMNMEKIEKMFSNEHPFGVIRNLSTLSVDE